MTIGAPMTSKCSATTSDGKPCRMRPLQGSSPPLCFNHSPSTATARDKSRRAGGNAKAGRAVAPAKAAARAPTLPDPVTPPDPRNFMTDAERKALEDGPFWWWSFDTELEALEALAYVARAVITGAMTVNAARAASTAIKAMLPGLQELDRSRELRAVREMAEENGELDKALAGYSLKQCLKAGLTIADVRNLHADDLLEALGHQFPDDAHDDTH